MTLRFINKYGETVKETIAFGPMTVVAIPLPGDRVHVGSSLPMRVVERWFTYRPPNPDTPNETFIDIVLEWADSTR